jgi:hypothetical protein
MTHYRSTNPILEVDEKERKGKAGMGTGTGKKKPGNNTTRGAKER